MQQQIMCGIGFVFYGWFICQFFVIQSLVYSDGKWTLPVGKHNYMVSFYIYKLPKTLLRTRRQAITNTF